MHCLTSAELEDSYKASDGCQSTSTNRVNPSQQLPLDECFRRIQIDAPYIQSDEIHCMNSGIGSDSVRLLVAAKPLAFAQKASPHTPAKSMAAAPSDSRRRQIAVQICPPSCH
jgi:hypothetical protein